MFAAIIQKTYEDAQSKAISTNFLLSVRHANLNKFSLQTFNRLAYEQKVNESLATLCLLSLLDYYSSDILVQCINLNFLRCYFISIILYRLNILQLSDNNAIFMSFL